MVESPLTTLWEIWEHTPGEVHGNSGYNHGWAGGPMVLLSQYYAGIVPDNEKKDNYVIKPTLAGLDWIDASVPTAKGFVKVDIRQQENGFQVTCTVPAGLTARLGLPKGDAPFKSITLNRKPLSMANEQTTSENDNRFWMELRPGTYRIAATR
jgi:hypothetical protein